MISVDRNNFWICPHCGHRNRLFIPDKTDFEFDYCKCCGDTYKIFNGVTNENSRTS